MRATIIPELTHRHARSRARTRHAALRHFSFLAALVCAVGLMGLLASCAKPDSAAPAAEGSTAESSPGSRNAAATDVPQAASPADEGRPAAEPPPAAAAAAAAHSHAKAAQQEAALPPFPWPPPRASASMVIPRNVLLQNMHLKSAKSAVRLKDVDAVLRTALSHAGYEHSYFSVTRGFALVSRMERITDAGAPYPDPKVRFNASVKLVDHFSLTDYLQALFVAPPGYFRLIVFIVSPQPFAATGKPISADDANAWLQQGTNLLPDAAGEPSYSKDYACTALIYEFEKRDTKTDPFERQPGRLSAETHLLMSGIKLGPLKEPAP